MVTAKGTAARKPRPKKVKNVRTVSVPPVSTDTRHFEIDLDKVFQSVKEQIEDGLDNTLYGSVYKAADQEFYLYGCVKEVKSA